MRIRYLKPAFFLSEALADLPFEFRLVYAGLWCCADKLGRLKNRPKRLGAEIMPYDKVDIKKAIDALAEQKLITKYEIQGIEYIQIEKWKIHQRVHYTEKDSIIPSYSNSNITYKGKRKGKGKGKGKAENGKQETPNGDIPVKYPLNTSYIPVIPIYRKFKHLKITVEDNKRLLALGYNQGEIDSIYDAIENHKKNTNYTSLYLTAKNWLERRNSSKPKAMALKGKYANLPMQEIGGKK